MVSSSLANKDTEAEGVGSQPSPNPTTGQALPHTATQITLTEACG